MNFDNILGIHERALGLQSRRAELLSANLANVDTPGYKARDIDFRAALQTAEQEQSGFGPMLISHQSHLQPEGYAFGAEILYRQPLQASLDGNSVEAPIEMSAYSENAMRYLMSLRIVSGRLEKLITSFRGE